MEIPKSLKNGKITDIHDCKTTWFGHAVKNPLKALLVTLLKQYPEPENLKNPNARVWLEIKEEYRKHEKLRSIQVLADLMFNCIIAEHEHDAPYEQRIDWVAKEVFEAISDGRYVLRDPLPQYSWEED